MANNTGTMTNSERTRLIIKSYRGELWNPFIRALKEFELISEGDVVGIAFSGGKDSILLSYIIEELKRHSKTRFETRHLAIDPSFDAENSCHLEDLANEMNIDLKLYKTELFNIVKDSGSKSPCFLCARMRRGYLYERALELGCNKLALGHHMDDVAETIMMNILYQGKYMTMMPRIAASNFEGISLIRPLYYVQEKSIIKWIKASGLNPLTDACPLKDEGDGMRAKVKAIIRDLENENPNAKKSIQKSAHNVYTDAVIGTK